MGIVRISAIGICGVFFSLFLKETKQEYSVWITWGICILLLTLSVEKLSGVLEALAEIQKHLPVHAEYMTTLIKMIGITYVGQFSAGICRDAGYQNTGQQIELFCRLSLLAMSIPILLALLQTIEECMI